jgi:5'-nucleotidase
VVVVAAHVGSEVQPTSTTPAICRRAISEEELFEDRPTRCRAGLVDVIVAGHTHAAMAHRVGEVAVIESYSSGRAFGRVDLRINPSGVVTAVKTILPAAAICVSRPPTGRRSPAPTVSPAPTRASRSRPRPRRRRADRAGAQAAAPRLEQQAARRDAGRTEVTARRTTSESGRGQPVRRSDARRPMPGGGRRGDQRRRVAGRSCRVGPLTYGALYDAMPFDNRFAVVTLAGAHVRKHGQQQPARPAAAILSWSAA